MFEGYSVWGDSDGLWVSQPEGPAKPLLVASEVARLGILRQAFMAAQQNGAEHTVPLNRMIRFKHILGLR